MKRNIIKELKMNTVKVAGMMFAIYKYKHWQSRVGRPLLNECV